MRGSRKKVSTQQGALHSPGKQAVHDPVCSEQRNLEPTGNPVVSASRADARVTECGYRQFHDVVRKKNAFGTPRTRCYTLQARARPGAFKAGQGLLTDATQNTNTPTASLATVKATRSILRVHVVGRNMPLDAPSSLGISESDTREVTSSKAVRADRSPFRHAGLNAGGQPAEPTPPPSR